MGDLEDRRERNFDVVSSVLGNNFHFAASHTIMQTAGGLAGRSGGAFPSRRLGAGNWRPFIPAHLPGSQRSIRLQRARLPDQPALPLGVVLDAPAPYFVAEEEVPRAGRLVTRGFRRAAGPRGITFLWMGRESPVGRGEGSSGLVFDRVEEPPPA